MIKMRLSSQILASLKSVAVQQNVAYSLRSKLASKSILYASLFGHAILQDTQVVPCWYYKHISTSSADCWEVVDTCAGVSPEVVELADQCVLVPMMGFVESYNVSVAAALTLYEARCGRSATAAAAAAAAAAAGLGSDDCAASSPERAAALLLNGGDGLTAEEQRVLVALMLLRQTVRISLGLCKKRL